MPKLSLLVHTTTTATTFLVHLLDAVATILCLLRDAKYYYYKRERLSFAYVQVLKGEERKGQTGFFISQRREEKKRKGKKKRIPQAEKFRGQSQEKRKGQQHILFKHQLFSSSLFSFHRLCVIHLRSFFFCFFLS